MLMLNSNESIKVGDFQKLATQSIYIGTPVIEMVNRTVSCRPEGLHFY